MADLRRIPSTDRLMRDPGLASYPLATRSAAARAAIARIRDDGLDPDLAPLLAAEEAARLSGPNLGRVINLSGVVLHTGLGRARLAPRAVDAVRSVAEGHANVEFDLDTGRRGDRQAHVRDLLCRLSGAESALVVNNCAAATVLTLAALCGGREVVLSRGQMVEIGGSFRLPEIVLQSGCRLVEVGCTNRTSPRDYQRAITEETAALLRCHPSNYRIIGFTNEVSSCELAALAHEAGVLMIDDVGSGCFVDTTVYGLAKEPTVPESIAAGSDVVLCSGDKLLGGPQAGIILGKSRFIDVIAAHPLARAFRIDKLTLAGLEATLGLYVEGREKEVPVWKYLARSPAEIRALARRLRVNERAEIVPSVSEVGGGSLPGQSLPTYVLAVPGEVEQLLSGLRQWPTPIIGRIEDGRVLLDPRTLELSEVGPVREALHALT